MTFLLAAVLAAAAVAATQGGARDEGEAGARWEGTSWEEARRTGKARIVIAYFPVAAPGATDDGAPRGFETEMMNLFVHHLESEEGLEVEVEWRPTASFREILSKVADGSGGVFGVNQISATAERRERLTFSLPYMKSYAVLLTDADVPTAGSMEELVESLRGRRAVTVPETTFAAFLEELRSGPLPELEIEWVESAADVPAAIRESPGEVFGYVDYALFGLALDAGIELRRHPVADRTTASLAVAMPKGSDWAPAIDRFLDPVDGFPADLGWELLVRRYLGAEMLGKLRP